MTNARRTVQFDSDRRDFSHLGHDLVDNEDGMECQTYRCSMHTCDPNVPISSPIQYIAALASYEPSLCAQSLSCEMLRHTSCWTPWLEVLSQREA